MKKLFALTLTVVALGLFAAGCSEAAKEPKPGTGQPAAAVEVVPDGGLSNEVFVPPAATEEEK